MTPFRLEIEVTGPGVVSRWNRTITNPMPAAATRVARRTTPTLREAEGRGSFGPRARARAYTSGTSRSSSERKRSWMSVTGLLQERAQALPRLREMHPDGRLAATQDAGNVADRKVGVLVQGDRGALVRAQASQRSDQVSDRFRHVVAELWHLTGATAPRLQLPRRDPERRPPDPPVVISDGVPATERLCERFGHRVGRDVRVGREGHQRSPELGALLLPYALDRIARLQAHRCILHHTDTGSRSG